MSEAPKNEALFDIAGRYVLELKTVLNSEKVFEGTDYEDAAFSQSLRNDGQHLLRFHNSQRAAHAKQIWDKYSSKRAKF